jgi:16S rRNA (adenine1518-N6/adenine1519-N6)-dimethyltransferase
MSRQRLGQNFLTDRSVAGRIIHAANVTADSVIVEIGPGRGALTDQLAASAGRLVVIEFDHGLALALQEKFADSGTVTALEADARTFSPTDLPFPAGTPYTLVANLPYYAATAIIRHFVESEAPPADMVVMVQREVGNEMRAKPGDMSMLSVAIQVYAEAERLFEVPPAAFTPKPKVHSTVLRITPRAEPLVSGDETDSFFSLVKAGFKAQRKQMHNSLAGGLNIDGALAKELLEGAGIDSGRRPATLSIPEWKTLYGVWAAAGKPFVTHGTSRSEREKALRR